MIYNSNITAYIVCIRYTKVRINVENRELLDDLLKNSRNDKLITDKMKYKKVLNEIEKAIFCSLLK